MKEAIKRSVYFYISYDAKLKPSARPKHPDQYRDRGGQDQDQDQGSQDVPRPQFFGLETVSRSRPQSRDHITDNSFSHLTATLLYWILSIFNQFIKSFIETSISVSVVLNLKNGWFQWRTFEIFANALTIFSCGITKLQFDIQLSIYYLFIQCIKWHGV